MEVILLTGASGGLGYKLARSLLEQGYFVILHYHKHKEKLEELHEKYPNSSILVSCDLKSEEEIHRMISEMKDYKIKHLINNAGIDHVSEIEKKDMESFTSVLKVNTIAPFLLMKHFIKEIQKQEGSIINISSDNAIDRPDMVTLEYDISKKGLNHLTQMFASDYPDAHINALCFGWLDTPMNDIPDEIKKELDFVPIEKAVEEIIKLLSTDKTGTIEIVR